MPYRLLRPVHVERGRTYPLLVIFHGSGAIGTDNTSQIGALAKQWASPSMREQYPAFVLIPQFRERSANYIDNVSHGTPLLDEAMALIEETIATLPVDRSRVYAIGFSMGGSAVWNAITLRPGLFDAAVSVAGVPNRAAFAHLGDTRLLLVHGEADTENPYVAARAAYDVAPQERVEFWSYPGLAHEFPQELLTSDKLARWLWNAGVPAG